MSQINLKRWPLDLIDDKVKGSKGDKKDKI